MRTESRRTNVKECKRRSMRTGGTKYRSPERLALAALAAWGLTALGPETSLTRTEAQTGGNWAAGYDYGFTRALPGTVNFDEFVRGVDVHEDGLVWSVRGLDGNGGNLESCSCAQISVSVGVGNFKSTNLCTIRGNNWGPYFAPTKIWPNDMVSTDPSDTLSGIPIPENAYYRAAAVGGWRATLEYDSFEGGDNDPIDSCAINAGGNAWLWIVSLDRKGAYDTATSTFLEDEDHLVTFVASNSVPSSMVEIKTIDEFAPPSIDGTLDVSFFSTGFVTGGEMSGEAYFSGSCTLPSGSPEIVYTSQGGKDAFIALHALSDGQLIGVNAGDADPVLVLGGSLDDGILSVDLNDRTQEIIVTGYTFSTNLDFDPDPTNTVYSNNQGGSDLFVASYRYGIKQGSQQLWHLEWVYTYGDAVAGNNYSGQGVMVDGAIQLNPGDADVYSGINTHCSGVNVTGYRTTPTDTGDLLVMRWAGNSPTPTPPSIHSLAWSHVVSGTESGHVRGLDLHLDALGRPTITGEFSDTVAFPVPPQASAVTITATGPNLATTTDGFVAKFDPFTGAALWAKAIGGSGNDTSTDLSICQWNSSRMVHGGNFRDTVNFGTGNQYIASSIDGYASVLEYSPIGEPVQHITMLVSTFGDPQEAGYKRHNLPVFPVADLFDDLDQDPATPFGAFSFSLLAYQAEGFGRVSPNQPSPGNPNRAFAAQIIPITCVETMDEARLIARKLREHDWDRLWVGGAVETFSIEAALRAASDYFDPASNFAFKYPSYADYRHVFAPLHDSTLLIDTALRDAITKKGLTVDPTFNQINGLAIDRGSSNPTVTRGQVKTDFAESQVQFTLTDGESNLSIAAFAENGTAIDPWRNPGTLGYASVVKRLFLRMSVCPSDYNRDGVSNASDTTDFQAAYLLNLPYADWNFDGQFTGSGGNIADGAKFNAGFGSQPGGCPNN